MTLPAERTHAVQRTHEFLRDLLDPKKTPRVPKAIRKKAYQCLRHFPWTSHLDYSAKALPRIWGQPEKDKA